MRKRFWPNLSGNTHVKNPRGPNTRVHKVFWQLWKIFSVTPKRLLKTSIFEKKRQTFKWMKDFGLSFCIIGCDKLQGTIDKGPQGILIFTVEVIGSFLWDLTGCCKRKFLKKRQSFLWGKDFGLIFLAIPMWRTSGDKLKKSKRYFANCWGS